MITGSRLRELRKSKGLSRRELAELLQIGEANIQRYESEESDSTSENVTKIARFFNVSTDYLLGLADRPSPYAGGDLSVQELAAISAWRRGDYREAIKVIVGDE
jgi:transcriptional regulator with XRE-family HTH domain